MLKILYAILSCDRYIESRCRSTQNTWLKHINKNSDYIIITSNHQEDKFYCTHTHDDYMMVSYKWVNFLQNYDFSSYDWVFSIDDDTFIFPDRLENYILDKEYNKKENIAMGAQHCIFHTIEGTLFCGGGGILISSEGIKTFQNYIKNMSEQDLSSILRILDGFMFDAFKKLNFQIINTNINNSSFGPFCPHKYQDWKNNKQFIDSAISLHYCDSLDKQELYSQYYSVSK